MRCRAMQRNRFPIPLLSGCLVAMTAHGAGHRADGSADTAALTAQSANDQATLQSVLRGDWRDPKNVARDIHRHPAETLEFFGLEPTQTVVEITPGGGWYAEILAPYLRDKGHYVAAVVDPAALAEGGGRDYQQKSLDGLLQKFAAGPAQYAKAAVAKYD